MTYLLTTSGIELHYAQCTRRVLFCVQTYTLTMTMPYWTVLLLAVLLLAVLAVLAVQALRVIGMLWTRIVVAFLFIRAMRGSQS